MIWILTILLVSFFLLAFIAAFLQVESNAKRAKDELSYKADVYGGPAGDPFWEGALPTEVTDYVTPRYVYENLVESTDFLPHNGRIIGYRISPTLVIHSRIQRDVTPSCLLAYMERFNGNLLQGDELRLMQENWDAVSALRQKAGDTPLDIEWFWARPKHLPMVVHYKLNLSKDTIGVSASWYPLILKR